MWRTWAGTVWDVGVQRGYIYIYNLRMVPNQKSNISDCFGFQNGFYPYIPFTNVILSTPSLDLDLPGFGMCGVLQWSCHNLCGISLLSWIDHVIESFMICKIHIEISPSHSLRSLYPHFPLYDVWVWPFVYPGMCNEMALLGKNEGLGLNINQGIQEMNLVLATGVRSKYHVVVFWYWCTDHWNIFYIIQIIIYIYNIYRSATSNICWISWTKKRCSGLTHTTSAKQK